MSLYVERIKWVKVSYTQQVRFMSLTQEDLPYSKSNQTYQNVSTFF